MNVVTSAKVEVMHYAVDAVNLSLSSFCVQDYRKRNQPISLKLGTIIVSTNQKNLCAFGGNVVMDTESGSLFHFPHRCGIGDLGHVLAFLSRFSRHLAK